MEEQTPVVIPEPGEPRRCPVCGSRVANQASTCLMCGTSLDVEAEEEAAPEEAPKRRFHIQIPWRELIAGILTAVAALALVGWFVRSQVMGPSATPTPSLTPTVTSTPTETPEPTDSPTPTLSPTPVPPRVHQVQEGETCVSVAALYDVALDALVSMNQEECGPGGIIRPGDLLLVPVIDVPVEVGPGTPSPVPQCPRLHVVRPGETGLGIAELYDVPFSLLEAANPQVNLSELRVNQVLQVPCGTPVPTPVPTADPSASPTPLPKYTAPTLLSPPDGATLETPLVPLQWTAVSLLRENEMYAVRLRRLDEDVPVESIYTRTTLVRLDEAYAPLAEDPSREYSWEVTVVRLTGTSPTGEPRYGAASYPSRRRTFRWIFNEAVVTSAAEP